MPFYKMTDRRKREDGYWEKRERIEKEHTLVVPKCIERIYRFEVNEGDKVAFIAEIGLTPDGKLRRSKIFSASGVKLIDRMDAIDHPTTWKPDEWTARHFAWRYCYDALVSLILDKEKEEAENPQLF